MCRKEEKMDKKTTGIVAYITWIGLIIAYFAGDKEGAKFHINQALVIWLGFIIANIVSYIPLVGKIISLVLWVFLFVCFILGLIAACKEEEKEVPLIGKIKILK
jgi:uncharacterized membrane protein